MRVDQIEWTERGGWSSPRNRLRDKIQALMVFGSPAALCRPKWRPALRSTYPNAHIFGCSTAGEIIGTRVQDDSLVATAMAFDSSEVRGAQIEIESVSDSFEAGRELVRSMDTDGLVHLFVLSDGLHVNGSELVEGLSSGLPEQVTITGGLSGDGDRFEKTLVMWDGPPKERTVAALGLYGDGLRVGCGSLGGWDPFGPERTITRSSHNILYELDGRSALELYKTYLGEHAAGLPATGLLFPLCVRTGDSETPVVRTILGIDEASQSLVFAGDVPQGAIARLMKANVDRLIDGAEGAARACRERLEGSSPDLAVLISCVGRKLVLRQRVEEEVESVRSVLGRQTLMTGFYSYGEISPFTPSAKCELHNQTMTITTFAEE